jgi:hypothetical protein
MKRVYQKIYRIFAKWLQPKYAVSHCEDLPLQLKSHTLYLIGEYDDPWQAAFICPCGCKGIIQLSLLKDSRPQWKVVFSSPNNISLYPSIHRTVGCKSHFFLNNGKIEWAYSTRY